MLWFQVEFVSWNTGGVHMFKPLSDSSSAALADNCEGSTLQPIPGMTSSLKGLPEAQTIRKVEVWEDRSLVITTNQDDLIFLSSGLWSFAQYGPKKFRLVKMTPVTGLFGSDPEWFQCTIELP